MGLAIPPTDWTNGYKTWCVYWPFSPQWEAILRGLLQSPIEIGFWDRYAGDATGAILAIENTLDKNMSMEVCMVPVGTVLNFAGNIEPEGYLPCFGQEVSRTVYSELFDVIGTIWGAGNGTTTFNLPSTEGKFEIGWSSTENEFNDVGNIGGEKTHTLTSPEMPVHTHVQNPHNHIQDEHSHSQAWMVAGNTFAGGTGADAGNTQTGATTATNQPNTATNQNAGGGEAHNNIPPYGVYYKIIKY